jgi:Methyltransferase domain
MGATGPAVEVDRPSATAQDGHVDRSIGAAAQWDRAYAGGEQHLSWYQRRPALSLTMIERAGIGPTAAVIDIGGGSSRLVDHLLDRGFTDVTVLDISAEPLAEGRRRLASRGRAVSWLVDDVRIWRPGRRYQLWHDRATFHFQVEQCDRDGYLAALDVATAPGSVAIFATFAPDGPTDCSGLPVERYSPQQIAATLGTAWELAGHEHEHHTTPTGAIQSFTWTTLRKR